MAGNRGGVEQASQRRWAAIRGRRGYETCGADLGRRQEAAKDGAPDVMERLFAYKGVKDPAAASLTALAGWYGKRWRRKR